MLEDLLIFATGSIGGWFLDTAYRSIRQKKFSPGEYLPLFAPEYGAGLLSLVKLKGLDIDLIGFSLLGGMALSGIEYVAGTTYEKLLGKKLWDYSENFGNLQGHIDLLHSSYWTGLSALAYFVLPEVLK